MMFYFIYLFIWYEVVGGIQTWNSTNILLKINAQFNGPNTSWLDYLSLFRYVIGNYMFDVINDLLG